MWPLAHLSNYGLFGYSIEQDGDGNMYSSNASVSADVDWIIEVVVERLDIKQRIFEKVQKYRKPGSIVSSNTSSIPISQLAQGRSEDFKKHFCGTHFFNPPRYLRLLEIIPIAETRAELVDFFKAIAVNAAYFFFDKTPN